MKRKYRLFVVSDIHGHYTLLKQALDDAGFDPENESHLFVCCGDLFDRGKENRQVYDYVRRLKHKILIRGNHDERLAKVLETRQITLVDLRNGLGTTLLSFFGDSVVDPSGGLRLPKYGKMAGRLRNFVASMADYFETEHYVFTHGYLPLVPDILQSFVREDWRTADAQAWHYARYLEWNLLYNTPARVRGKTIVCGHRAARYACFFDPDRDREDYRIFFGRGVIAVDGCTVRSGIVNVLVVDEEIEESLIPGTGEEKP